MLRDPADDAGLLPVEKRIARKKATAERRLAASRARKKSSSEGDDPRIAPARDQQADRRMKMIPDGAVLSAFMQDWAFVTIIRGPWGSGKSVGCIGKLFMAGAHQLPDAQGKRRTRWAVVRDSYPNLQETTIKTWLEWFPEEVYGPMRRSRPMQHMIKLPGAPHNGKPTMIEMEVLFLALDDEEDRKKLLSIEFTGAWINEAREIAKPIIDDIIGRTERFPSMRDGGATWGGVIMDTNAPSETHWLPLMMGEAPIPETMSDEDRESLKRPANWNYYTQPGALREIKDKDGRVIAYEPNPGAENVLYLKGGFDWYMKRLGGKTRSWIRVNFCNQLGQLVAGKAVWPTFERLRHVSSSPIPYDPDLPLIVGLDPTGRQPAAVFMQPWRNTFRVLSERVGSDIPAETFAPIVRREVARLGASVGIALDRMTVTYYRDPHQQRSEVDDNTTDMVFRKHGMRLIPAPGGNGIKHRLDTVEVLIDQNRIMISVNCIMLIAGCEGGYHYRKLRVSGREEYAEDPEKNGYSHPCDALQYAVLGAGEGRTQTRTGDRPKPAKVATRYSPRENRDDLWARRRARAAG